MKPFVPQFTQATDLLLHPLTADNVRLGLVVQSREVSLGFVSAINLSLARSSLTVSSLTPHQGYFDRHPGEIYPEAEDPWIIVGHGNPYELEAAREQYQQQMSAATIQMALDMPVPDKVTVVMRYLEATPEYPEAYHRISDTVAIHRRILIIGPKEKLDLLKEAQDIEDTLYE